MRRAKAGWWVSGCLSGAVKEEKIHRTIRDSAQAFMSRYTPSVTIIQGNG
jgi:hypothetical protein